MRPLVLAAASLLALAACAMPMRRAAVTTLPETRTAITREQAVATLVDARALVERHDYARARARVAPVLVEAQRWGWAEVEADGQYLLGEMLDRERTPRAAADAYARAYDASRRLGDRARGLLALNALTNALLDAGAAAKAREAAGEALRLATREQDVAAQATAQNNFAEADRIAGKLDAAREGYERALALARQASDRAAVASILLNLGAAERRAGRLDAARARFVEAQDLARSLDDTRAGAYARWNLEQIEADITQRGGNR
jgi:tetratricopeptide (TPR) repeat protein